MTVDQFRQVNGFSNMFWGWGGEDDDMSNRLRQKKLYISRYPANIASKLIWRDFFHSFHEFGAKFKEILLRKVQYDPLMMNQKEARR